LTRRRASKAFFIFYNVETFCLLFVFAEHYLRPRLLLRFGGTTIGGGRSG
jgi:hypothetical protein